MNVRKFAAGAIGTVSIALLVGLAPAGARSHTARPKPNILLVHGVWADGSSWSGVIARLQADGYNVVASQIPLTSFADDVAVVQRDLRVLGGPTLVVGHSYGGQVITQAAQDAPNVVGVVGGLNLSSQQRVVPGTVGGASDRCERRVDDQRGELGWGDAAVVAQARPRAGRSGDSSVRAG